jgi:hypothetical protein
MELNSTSQAVITNGSRAVSIVKNAKFEATLYVNCQNGLGDRTLVSKKFTTLAGATKWAEGTLA